MPRYVGLQIRKNLQRPGVVFFEGDLDLIEETRFLAHQSIVIPSQHLKFLSRLGIGLKSSKMHMIGSHKFRQHISIKQVALRVAHAKPILSSYSSALGLTG